uniref:Protein kinase domain-containing protein n=1 Tax=Panagrolaimus davidi TaxID=227884 RepID=A0A914R9Q4_9BILA
MEKFYISNMFQTVNVIGSGSEAVIYQCLYKPTRERCAAKVQPLTSKAVEELKMLKKFDHDLIIRYFGDFVEKINGEKNLIILMELADMPLYAYINRVKPINNPIRFRSIAAQLVEAVHILHSNGIIHRDLSYYNILIKRNIIKISDFDVATTVENDAFHTVGHFRIQSPEMLLRFKYDQKTDVWSLGCILHFIATGNIPFEDDSSAFVLRKIGREIGFPKEYKEVLRFYTQGDGNFYYKSRPFESLKKVIGDENWDLIIQCLKTNPEERATSSELYNHRTFYEYFNYTMIPSVVQKPVRTSCKKPQKQRGRSTYVC